MLKRAQDARETLRTWVSSMSEAETVNALEYLTSHGYVPHQNAQAPAGATIAKPSWSGSACELWERYMGAVGSLAGRVGKSLRPLEAQYGWDVVGREWEAALQEAVLMDNPAYFTPETFARTFLVRLNRHSRQAVAVGGAVMPQGKTMRAVQDSSRAFLSMVQEVKRDQPPGLRSGHERAGDLTPAGRVAGGGLADGDEAAVLPGPVRRADD